MAPEPEQKTPEQKTPIAPAIGLNWPAGAVKPFLRIAKFVTSKIKMLNEPGIRTDGMTL